MHPVIEHIKARKNKHAPFHDRRRIALILPGGLMSAVRGAGAGAALLEMGLINSFDEIYTMSAGFPNAAYYLTQDISAMQVYYENLCNKEFLNFARFWDVVDIEYLMGIMREIRPLDYKKLSHSKTKLLVRLLDTKTDKAEYKKVNGREPKEIERMMRAAISVPFLNPGSIEINGKHYKDAGLLPQMESSVRDVLNTDATDILIIYNTHEQFEHLKHVGIKDGNRFLQIVPYSENEPGPLCRDSHHLKRAAEEMGTLVKSIFGENSPFILS
ncbi:MAG: FabD/lysophospholipase-like protein [Parcubacteria group bacterium]|nr:FabD/lysophospholipase-like protein [Parcubacteria group bacterium]